MDRELINRSKETIQLFHDTKIDDKTYGLLLKLSSLLCNDYYVRSL